MRLRTVISLLDLIFKNYIVYTLIFFNIIVTFLLQCYYNNKVERLQIQYYINLTLVRRVNGLGIVLIK